MGRTHGARSLPGAPKLSSRECPAPRDWSRELVNGEPGSLRGVSRARAAPPQPGGRVCAPGAGRADVRGSGPALLLECGWACLRAGYLCWCASPDLDGPASSYCRRGGASSAQASALPSPERIPGRAASRSLSASSRVSRPLSSGFRAAALTCGPRRGRRHSRLGRRWALFNQERSGVGAGQAAGKS